MRFLADMGISPATVARLRELGFDSVHLRESGLQRLSDSEIAEKAYREERILLTHDLDFSDIVAAGGPSLPSVIIFRLRDMRPVSVNRYLEMVIARHGAELAERVIMSVTESSVRLRKIPLE